MRCIFGFIALASCSAQAPAARPAPPAPPPATAASSDAAPDAATTLLADADAGAIALADAGTELADAAVSKADVPRNEKPRVETLCKSDGWLEQFIDATRPALVACFARSTSPQTVVLHVGFETKMGVDRSAYSWTEVSLSRGTKRDATAQCVERAFSSDFQHRMNRRCRFTVTWEP